MKRKTLSVILAIVMLLSLSLPALAADYTDLTGHWAKTYMEDLAARGYLTGYSDGSMKPDKNITAGETLVVMSRLYTLTDIEASMIQADYEAAVKAAVSSNLSWEYPYLENCLAAGITSSGELKTINLTSDITKEQLSVFLVRAMQLTDAAGKLSASALKFADTAKITSDDVGSVAELNSLSIVTGDDKNNFSPQASVTRAVAATMVSRALTYLSNNKLTLVIPAYEGLTQSEGIIVSAGAALADIACIDGLTREYSITADSTVTAGGNTVTAGTSYVGMHATLISRYGIVKSLVIDTGNTWLRGMVTKVSTQTGSNLITVTRTDTGTSLSYSVPSTASVTRNGTSATYGSIVSGDYVTMKYGASGATTVYALGSIASLTGTISALTFNTTVVLQVKASGGDTYVFAMDIGSLPAITRGGATITIDKLRVGNTVTISFTGCSLLQISSSGSKETETGQLLSSTSTVSGTVWVLLVEGVQKTYSVDEDAVAYSGTTTIDISSINVGDQVTVSIYNDTITDVTLKSAVVATSNVSGTVLAVNTTGMKITILTQAQKLVYINAGNMKSMLNVSNGYSLYLSNLTTGSTLTAYGSYTNTNTFAATMIIVQNLA